MSHLVRRRARQDSERSLPQGQPPQNGARRRSGGAAFGVGRHGDAMSDFAPVQGLECHWQLTKAMANAKMSVNNQPCMDGTSHIASESRQGRQDNSPALQCWDRDALWKESRQGRRIDEAFKRRDHDIIRISALKRLIYPPSLTGLSSFLTRIPSTEVLGYFIPLWDAEHISEPAKSKG